MSEDNISVNVYINQLESAKIPPIPDNKQTQDYRDYLIEGARRFLKEKKFIAAATLLGIAGLTEKLTCAANVIGNVVRGTLLETALTESGPEASFWIGKVVIAKFTGVFTLISAFVGIIDTCFSIAKVHKLLKNFKPARKKFCDSVIPKLELIVLLTEDLIKRIEEGKDYKPNLEEMRYNLQSLLDILKNFEEQFQNFQKEQAYQSIHLGFSLAIKAAFGVISIIIGIISLPIGGPFSIAAIVGGGVLCLTSIVDAGICLHLQKQTQIIKDVSTLTLDLKTELEIIESQLRTADLLLNESALAKLKMFKTQISEHLKKLKKQ